MTEAPRPRGRPPKPLPCLAAWIKSPRRLTVDALAWVPGEPEFCRVPEGFEGHETAFNTWRGLKPMGWPEDWQVRAQAFVDHVAYLVPIENERRRFMQWLAHIFQHPEVLPHTAYLMVTPTTGIGRNWLASVLVRALRGHVAVGVSLPELLDGGYTGRLSRKLLAIVDEAREGPSSQRYQRENRVRSMITEEHRLINPKYGVQSIEKNCCRWLMFSNYHDALPFNNKDRRIAVVDNPTERKGTDYYTRLYGMVEDPAFIGSVRRFLETWDISTFNPGEHAPMNQAKELALSVMKSEAENVIEDLRNECVTNGKELLSRRDIVDAVRNSGAAVNSAHINHAIIDAGMVNSGYRVKDRHGNLHGVVIVDATKWYVEKVKKTAGDVLLKAIGHSPEDLNRYGRGTGPQA